MPENDVVQRTPNGPITVRSLERDLTQLGIGPGMTVLCHTSLSALGWVCGGPVAVILALERVLAETGTLVMPTHSTQLTDPSQWGAPSVPEAWWPTIRASMPAFDPELTPTRGMGAIPETFRKQQGVRRSAHPHHSFAAWGAHAERAVAGHELDYGLGDASPLARIHELDAWVLLLGVGHDRSTSLHLAEHRASFPSRRETRDGAPVRVDGERQWVEVRCLATDDSDFATIAQAFDRETGEVRRGRVGNADAQLMPQRALVDFAVDWMEAHRD
ncbi:MAG: aminoglycoside N(3)-acetyltransferase [Candidatus Bipolaricaulia bacterium]